MGSKGWFKGLTIPYDRVKGLSIEQRQVGTFEGLAGGLNSRQLNQPNNIHLIYATGGPELLLRLEMISGVTVMGQAKKCQELEDLLRTRQVRDRFAATLPPASAMGNGIPEQIARLAKLRDEGILTDEQFEGKKLELLARM
jgi:hypothetical protein